MGKKRKKARKLYLRRKAVRVKVAEGSAGTFFINGQPLEVTSWEAHEVIPDGFRVVADPGVDKTRNF